MLAQPCSHFLSLLTELAAQASRTFQGVSPAGEALAPGPISTNTDRPPQSCSRRGAGTAGLGGGNIDHCGQGSRRELCRPASPASGRAARCYRSQGAPGSREQKPRLGPGLCKLGLASSLVGCNWAARSSSERPKALHDPRGFGPKATFRQMGICLFV